VAVASAGPCKSFAPCSRQITTPVSHHLISADNYCAATLIPEIGDPVYQVNITIIRKIHNHHHHHPKQRTGAIFYDWFPSLSIHQVKNFQEDQLNSSRFPVFAGGIKNSRRFPVFPKL